MGSEPATGNSAQSLPRVILDGSPDLHTVVSAEGVYRFASPGGAELFGWAPDDLIGQAQTSFTHPDDEPLVVDAHRSLLDGDESLMTTVQRFRCGDGSYRWAESRSSVVESGGGRVVVSAVRDIAERRKSELDLRRQAATDPLTGVANRTVFMDRLRQALRRLNRHRGLVAVIFLDLDRFKVINDSLGHHIGDAVLGQMAERLLQVLRPQDTLARLGGDEFAIVAEDLADPSDAIALGARIIEAGRRPFVVGDERFVCTTSAGIAVSTDPTGSAEGLLQDADLALYRAKDRGRDRFDVFDEDLRTRATGRLGIERMLRRAIDEDRLRIEYQPIVDLATGATVSAEALARVWDPDQPGLVPAATFIEVAEETGLLAPIDEWVLGQVLHQVASWHRQMDATSFGGVAVNITTRHLADTAFAQSMIDDLDARGLPTSAIQVEVTERVLIEASNSAMSGLDALRTAGVKVALDDFGTGYSSLSFLGMFPLDFVKLHQSFTGELAREGANGAVVGAVIDLAHALGLVVVAEGVETATQARQLRELGCDRAQGFHFAPSGPPEQLLRPPSDELP
jgi:diguanylate cyclase (GGDEF)-like protein/PAS domain S-box-containing protein